MSALSMITGPSPDTGTDPRSGVVFRGNTMDGCSPEQWTSPALGTRSRPIRQSDTSCQCCSVSTPGW